ncbi:MAG: hypothetical protein Q7S27_04610 [Nanoarchaeota archaeon]|nr:hypothetical protein [Nanoarchaeota archaeon]
MSKRFRENAFRILKSVYYMEDPKKITKEIKKNKVSGDEFVKVLLYLKNKGLVSYKDLEIPMEISLTDKGMEYVVSELKQERQEEFNKIIALTGAIVALVYFYNFLITLLGGKYQITISILFFIPLILCFVPIVNFIWREFRK